MKDDVKLARFTLRYRQSKEYDPEKARWVVRVGTHRFAVKQVELSASVVNVKGTSTLEGHGYITVFPGESRAVISSKCHVSHYNDEREIHVGGPVEEDDDIEPGVGSGEFPRFRNSAFRAPACR